MPIRNPGVDTTEPRPLPEPAASGEAARKTKVRSGSMERSVHTDLTNGKVTHKFFLDGGVFGPVGDFRLGDIGTVLSDVSDRRYTILPGDPLSAVATMEQTAGFDREDWAARIWTYSEQRATAPEFHLISRLKAWSGEELIFEEENAHVIPRNGM
ncbi:hypothetical protein [Ruegeria sp. HKCCA0235A]|uniref:hypothetical protein n=1 Tax=Ruegeria sp. HKCCA0235A TaxID=2682998 RepID=UPI001487EF48|nr:hypothetical protein [Ruegeria sp. HKCCA0235A]